MFFIGMIRPATLEDIPEIKRINDQAFDHGEKPSTFRSRILAYPQGCLVTTLQKKVIAHTSAEKRHRMTWYVRDYDARQRHSDEGIYLLLTSLAVDEKYRGKGIGEELLHRQMEFAKKEGCKGVMLFTLEAATYYPRFGFEIVKNITNDECTYYGMRKIF